MAYQVPSFMSSSKLIITVNKQVVAYAQNLSFSDEMSLQPVGGIGSINNHAIEPTMYMGRGQMTITNYSDLVYDNNTTEQNPTNIDSASQTYDGNSMLRHGFLNPVMILFAASFDIDVYERDFINEEAGKLTLKDGKLKTADPTYNNQGVLAYRLENCRINRYNIGWNVGSKVNETISFLCTSILDKSYETTRTKATFSKTEE